MRKTFDFHPVLLLLCGAVLSGCAPEAYVVLLENDNGTTGSIQVSGPEGTSIVNKAKTAAELNGATREPFAISDETIDETFGPALAAMPIKPEMFILKFETGGAKLTPESEALLPSVLTEIGKHPGADISIIGHTDTQGDAKKNIELGLKRAQFVADKLHQQNIQVYHETVTSHGESNPIVATPDNIDEPQNRRVEITVR
jgi:peptidoglycan-associated lipoprotein